jgi:hypothetical protein
MKKHLDTVRHTTAAKLLVYGPSLDPAGKDIPIPTHGELLAILASKKLLPHEVCFFTNWFFILCMSNKLIHRFQCV